MLQALLSIVCFLTVLSTAWGQSKSMRDLTMYKGTDYEQMLLEGAKKEGKVVWYTSLAGKSYKTIKAKFAEKYPDVKIEVYRAGSKDLATKILGEARAKKYLVDATETTPGILMLLKSQKIITPYTNPIHKKWPDFAQIKAKGGGVYWVTDRESFIGLGYNTQKLPEDQVPRNWDDLLNPALKDKMMMSTSSTGDRVIGTMLKYNGKEYVEKLKPQNMKLLNISGTATRDLIIAGEFIASPTVFRNHALVKINQGAPLGWVPMNQVPTNAGGSAVFTHAPHPHAALLLVNFILNEGQDILESFYYGMAWKDYPFKRVYPERGMTPRQYDKALKDWNKLLRSIGRKG
jgi:iron(III) transport system substrate-binding protein